MSKAKDNYQVIGTTVAELITSLNFLFQRFADRMDRIEGIRGVSSIESTLVMNSNPIVEVASGSVDDDAARLADLNDTVNTAIEALKSSNAIITGAWRFNADISVHADIKVYDADGNLIHSFE